MNVVRSAGGGADTSFAFDNENTVTKHPIIRPSCSIAELMQKTKFSRHEIQHLYRQFKQDCPSGEVSKTHFATIFGVLFPNGECFHYSSFVFQNIDRSNTGHLRFEDIVVTLSILMHGSIEDRLGWIFDLYDLNKDGILTKTELLQIVASIFKLIVPISKINFTSINNTIEERTEQLFQNWDTNGNGLVYKQDFLEYCLQDDILRRSIEIFKSDITL